MDKNINDCPFCGSRHFINTILDKLINVGFFGELEVGCNLYTPYSHNEKAILGVFIDWISNRDNDAKEFEIPINYCPKCGRKLEHEEDRKKGKATTLTAHTNILPEPCTIYSEATIKEGLQKIHEEIDELTEAIIKSAPSLKATMQDVLVLGDAECKNAILEEGTDAITAITTLLNGLGFSQKERQAAQARVNERNRDRGRMA